MLGSVFRWTLTNHSSPQSLLGILNNRSAMKGSRNCVFLVGVLGIKKNPAHTQSNLYPPRCEGHRNVLLILWMGYAKNMRGTWKLLVRSVLQKIRRDCMVHGWL